MKSGIRTVQSIVRALNSMGVTALLPFLYRRFWIFFTSDLHHHIKWVCTSNPTLPMFPGMDVVVWNSSPGMHYAKVEVRVEPTAEPDRRGILTVVVEYVNLMPLAGGMGYREAIHITPMSCFYGIYEHTLVFVGRDGDEVARTVHDGQYYGREGPVHQVLAGLIHAFGTPPKKE